MQSLVRQLGEAREELAATQARREAREGHAGKLKAALARLADFQAQVKVRVRVFVRVCKLKLRSSSGQLSWWG